MKRSVLFGLPMLSFVLILFGLSLLGVSCSSDDKEEIAWNWEEWEQEVFYDLEYLDNPADALIGNWVVTKYSPDDKLIDGTPYLRFNQDGTWETTVPMECLSGNHGTYSLIRIKDIKYSRTRAGINSEMQYAIRFYNQDSEIAFVDYGVHVSDRLMYLRPIGIYTYYGFYYYYFIRK